MSKNVDFLLIGGGAAAVSAAETLRAQGAEGTITLLAGEALPPYERPALSKHFLRGLRNKEDLLLLEESEYRDQNIELVTGAKAVALDCARKLVQTDRAGEIGFRKLLIATGAKPQRLAVPGADLSGIHYLHTLADAEALARAMHGARRAVVIGGSFIGTEVASVLTQRGIQVTLVAKEYTLFDTIATREHADIFTQYYQSRGIEVVFGQSIRAFRGAGRVDKVTTSRGKNIPCDFVAIGVGVIPETEFLSGSGIAVDDGVVVDEYLQTNQPDIYAAGDVANFFDPVFRMRRRVEHWDNARKQGRLAAENMLGRRRAYREVSYFFTEVFDLTFELLGCARDARERIQRGSIEEQSLAIFYLKDGRLRAMLSLRRPIAEVKAAESLILNRVDLGRAHGELADPGFPLEKLATQTVLILQGGGALGAFECGVVGAMEEEGVCPDIVAGVSIGAFNAAIIAGNPRDAAAALEGFWRELALHTPEIPEEQARQMLASWWALTFGSPRFFHPRWFRASLGLDQPPLYWTHFYDPAPVKELLHKYVDFKKLKDGPIRLLVSAVNVETAELEIFDNHADDITADHILASGSLPPGFPWTTIGEKHYWDGGIISNSPLDQVIERCGSSGKNVYIVDLYARNRALPTNIVEVMARRDEIFYSEKIRNNVRTHELLDSHKELVGRLMHLIDPATAERIKQRPLYIQLMADSAPVSITRMVYRVEAGELPSKDFDFSMKSLEERKRQGYRLAKQCLQERRALASTGASKARDAAVTANPKR